MGETISEIPHSQNHGDLASNLKDRVPSIHAKSITEEDLEEAWRFINNPFGSLDFFHGDPLAWDYDDQLKELQKTPLFGELQEAAKKHLALGYDSSICVYRAFYLTIHDLSFPELIGLRKKYGEKEKLTTSEEIKELFGDLEKVLANKRTKDVFFDNLVNTVPDTSPRWDERKEVAEFIRKQACDRRRFLVGDFGCGTGKWIRKLKEQLGDATMIFASDQQYHREKDRGKVPHYKWAPDKGLAFFQANFKNVPLVDNSLDCALLSYVVTHTTKELAARGLQEIERVLKEGGCLIVGPVDRKDGYTTGWAVLRKKNGKLIESEGEFIS
jgi:hypothetical protein